MDIAKWTSSSKSLQLAPNALLGKGSIASTDDGDFLIKNSFKTRNTNSNALAALGPDFEQVYRLAQCPHDSSFGKWI